LEFSLWIVLWCTDPQTSTPVIVRQHFSLNARLHCTKSPRGQEVSTVVPTVAVHHLNKKFPSLFPTTISATIFPLKTVDLYKLTLNFPTHFKTWTHSGTYLTILLLIHLHYSVWVKLITLTAIMKRCGAGAAGSPEYGKPSGVRISRPTAIKNSPPRKLRILDGFFTSKIRGTCKNMNNIVPHYGPLSWPQSKRSVSITWLNDGLTFKMTAM